MDAVLVEGIIPGIVAVSGFDPNYPDRTLDLTNVTSSRFVAIGYAAEQSLAYIAFKLDLVYEYQGVEPDTWDGLLEASSKGSYAIQYIIGKPRQPIYKYRKVMAAGDSFAEASTSIAQVKAEPRAEDTIPELPEKDEDLKTRALAVKAVAAALTKLDANRQIVIDSPEHYAAAANQLTTMKAERALVWQRTMRVYDPAYATYIAARTLRDEAVAPYDEAEQMLKKGMLAYTQNEARVRREAETVERKRLEAAEQERAREESNANANREAQYAEAQGEPELAQTIRATPISVAPKPVAAVVLQSAVPQVAGIVTKEKWEYRILNEAAIPLTHEFYTLDPKKLAARAKNMKSHGTIPDVFEVYDAGQISAGRTSKK